MEAQRDIQCFIDFTPGVDIQNYKLLQINYKYRVHIKLIDQILSTEEFTMRIGARGQSCPTSGVYSVRITRQPAHEIVQGREEGGGSAGVNFCTEIQITTNYSLS